MKFKFILSAVTMQKQSEKLMSKFGYVKLAYLGSFFSHCRKQKMKSCMLNQSP